MSNIYLFFFNTFCPLVQNPTVLPNGDWGKITKLQGKIENSLGTYSLENNWNGRRKCRWPLESFPQQGIGYTGCENGTLGGSARTGNWVIVNTPISLFLMKHEKYRFFPIRSWESTLFLLIFLLGAQRVQERAGVRASSLASGYGRRARERGVWRPRTKLFSSGWKNHGERIALGFIEGAGIPVFFFCSCFSPSPYSGTVSTIHVLTLFWVS